jgi:nucleotide-binding universal stress UspA family protein
MKLLIAVDSSTSTEVIVGAVGVRPWPGETTAHVLSVLVDAEVPLEVWREFGYGKNAVRREMKKRQEQITSAAVERLKEVGIPAEVVVARGDPRHLIPFFARKWSSDLIFVRAHVRKDFEHWMLGSVARSVVTSAPCSVQIVRTQPEDESQHTLNSARKVLLATDGSETSMAAAHVLAERPWPEGSKFRIVCVEEPWALADSKVRNNEQGQAAVSSAQRVLSAARLEATTAVLSGNTRDVILEEAKKWTADLIVVGSHGRRGFKRFLLGSVSEAIATNAHCSVVVVRDPARPSRKSRA